MDHGNTINLGKLRAPPVGSDNGQRPGLVRRKFAPVRIVVGGGAPLEHLAFESAPLPPHAADAAFGELLPRRHFVQQLQREKRRAERSKLALSIAVFWISTPADSAGQSEQRLLEVLVSGKRETDIVGHLGEGRLGVILADTGPEGALAFRHKIAARASGFAIESIVRTYPDDLFQDLGVDRRPEPEDDPLHLDTWQPAGKVPLLLKRCLDLAGGTTALVLFAPVMLLAAAAIAATSPGPVIYKQTRLGRGGVPFSFYKFRSMFANADERIHREYVTSIIKKEQESGKGPKEWSKLEHDPRITPVGRFIRKTSIDELPQLFNVLQGHLSLVGPRPPLPYEAAAYESWHLRRVLEVKPGITGLWQAGGRGATTFEDMVRLDLQYIKNRSLVLDVQILLKTVVVVLRRNGAK